MFTLGTHAYARIIHTNFVFFSFTSFTSSAILSKSSLSVKD